MKYLSNNRSYHIRYKNLDYGVHSLDCAPRKTINFVWHVQWRRRMGHYSKMDIPQSIARPHKNAVIRFNKKYPVVLAMNHPYYHRRFKNYYF